MSRPTVASLVARVDQLEQGHRAGPLDTAELAELQALETEYRRLFPVPVDQMPDAEVDDLIEYLRSPATQRFMELQGRCPRTAEATAKSQALLDQLEHMSAEEAGAFWAAQAKLPPSEIGRESLVGPSSFCRLSSSQSFLKVVKKVD